MTKQFFYEFYGRVFLKAVNKNQAKKIITGTPLHEYILDEDIIQIDQNYIPVDLEQRQEQLNTSFHPLDDPKDYESFRIMEIRYSGVFNDFLNGKFGRNELLKKLDEADEKSIDSGDLVYSVEMVDLESKKGKTTRLVAVD